MNDQHDIARASVAEADSSAANASSQGSPTLEWPTADFQEVLEALGPEERELVILAATGC